jgi:large subunit ribosomal protein L31
MKTGIHPEVSAVSVKCASCGTTYELRSTAEKFSVDTCAQCHPAYTGRAAKVTGGSRIERFERRLERAQIA